MKIRKAALSFLTAMVCAASTTFTGAISLIAEASTSANKGTYGDFIYETADEDWDGTLDHIVINDYSGTSEEVVIPSEIDGLPVTVIAPERWSYRAFSDLENLKSVTIPESVTTIRWAFEDCTALTSVVIPDSVTYIYDSFCGCTSLENVTVSDSMTVEESVFEETPFLENQTGVKYVGKWAVGCDADMTSAVIKDGTVGISNYAFSGCTSLTSITIPDSVTNIGEAAFADCTSLTSITIPEGVTEILGNTFSGCENLTDITLPDSIAYIGTYAFDTTKLYEVQDGVTYIGKIVVDCDPDVTEVHIRAGSTVIAAAAFENCSLTNIEIPDSIIGIGDNAFYGCKSLTEITIPSDLEYLGDSAFFECELLKDVDLPESISKIGGSVFYGCKSLEKIVLPDNMKTLPWVETDPDVGYGFFAGCESLKEVTLPANLKELDNCAFYKCTALEKIVIPEGVTYIGDSAFSECTSLTDITIPKSAERIDSWTFSGTPWLEAKQAEDPMVIVNDILINAEKCSGEVVVPGTVKTIANSAFSGSDATSITVSEGVENIDGAAFGNFAGLESVVLPSTVHELVWAYSQFDPMGPISVYSGVDSTIKLTIKDPDCAIINDAYFLSRNMYLDDYASYVTLCGYEGSTLQAYAEEFGYDFEVLDPDSEPAVGDVDGNGKTDLYDLIRICRSIVNAVTLTDDEMKIADMDGNGIINVYDAIKLARIIAGSN